MNISAAISKHAWKEEPVQTLNVTDAWSVADIIDRFSDEIADGVGDDSFDIMDVADGFLEGAFITTITKQLKAVISKHNIAVELLDVTFDELDSGNLSHAAAYFNYELRGKITDIIGLSKVINEYYDEHGTDGKIFLPYIEEDDMEGLVEDNMTSESSSLKLSWREESYDHYSEDDAGNRWYFDEDNSWHREDGPAIEKIDGTKTWFQHGRQHREDGPSHIGPDGYTEWTINDEYHRIGGPARTWDNGEEEWYQHGKLHRLDGPAIVHSNGNGAYFLYNNRIDRDNFISLVKSLREVDPDNIASLRKKLSWKEKAWDEMDVDDENGKVRYYDEDGLPHRDDGPAVIDDDGTEIWYQHGTFHREDGPAVHGPSGNKTWYQKGRIHRTDGPAVVKANGHVEYWIHGIVMGEDRFNQIVHQSTAGLTFSWRENPFMDVPNLDKRNLERRMPKRFRKSSARGWLISYLYENGPTQLYTIYKDFVRFRGEDPAELKAEHMWSSEDIIGRQGVTEGGRYVNITSHGPKYYQEVSSRITDLMHNGYTINKGQTGLWELTDLGYQMYDASTESDWFIGSSLLDYK